MMVDRSYSERSHRGDEVAAMEGRELCQKSREHAVVIEQGKGTYGESEQKRRELYKNIHESFKIAVVCCAALLNYRVDLVVNIGRSCIRFREKPHRESSDSFPSLL